MKVVILAGGLGTRISEETIYKPKPMVLIGDKPILWHIMKSYASYGFNDFAIALGYKGDVIKEFFLNYKLHKSEIVLNLKSGIINYHNYGVAVALKDTNFSSLVIDDNITHMNSKDTFLNVNEIIAEAFSVIEKR